MTGKRTVSAKRLWLYLATYNICFMILKLLREEMAIIIVSGSKFCVSAWWHTAHKYQTDSNVISDILSSVESKLQLCLLSVVGDLLTETCYSMLMKK